MTIKIQCPHCAQRISATEDVLGTTVECPTCNRPFKAVAMAPPPPAPGPAEASGEHTVPPRDEPAEKSPAHKAPPVPPRSPLPLTRPAPKRKSGTIIMIVCALAVVAGGLYWWQTQGPGFTDKPKTPPAGNAAGKTAGPAQPDQNTAPAAPSDAAGSDVKDFEGVWRGTIPRTVLYKPYDASLTITFNERGEGFPKFETPEGDSASIAGAGLATLFKSDRTDKVILLREWDVTLSADKKTMLWSEVNGPARVKLTKQ